MMNFQMASVGATENIEITAHEAVTMAGDVRIRPATARDAGAIARLYSISSDGVGYVDPASICQGYVQRARDLGVEFRTGTPVTGINVKGDRVTGVVTEGGEICTDAVVNACGPFLHRLGEMAGVARRTPSARSRTPPCGHRTRSGDRANARRSHRAP